LFYETKANLTKDQLRILRDVGTVSIQPGIESFSTEILRGMRKGTTAIQNIQILKWCKEFHIKALWNLLYGFPGEDPTEYNEIVNIINNVHHLDPPQGFGRIRLDRFSPHFVRAADYGICDIRPDRSYQFIYDLPEPEVRNIAYYFEHEYRDGRTPDSYVEETHDAILRWQENFGGRGLVYVDHGDSLAIWDWRANAVRQLTILIGAERDLVLECDQNRSHQHVKGFLEARGYLTGEVDALLERLILDRIMIEIDGRFLSLPIPAENPGDPDGTSATWHLEEYLIP